MSDQITAKHLEYWDRFYHPAATMGVKHEWISQDAWHRKDLDNGTYVICSRSCAGGWEWRHTSYSGRVLDFGAAFTAGEAKRYADATLNLVKVAA